MTAERVIDEEILRRAASLASVYGDVWNNLPQEERLSYVLCVETIRRVATKEAKP